ncbi:GDP-mannose transporter GONST1-like isoform X2 [Apium graveolens]|uniref:GDP-mannose transporter GONST1-like isoform X2 n=1 Tax=Apium graveolens TaxID=4045 RepID=UPI003D7B509A
MKPSSNKELDVESGKFDSEREKLIPSARPVQKNNQAFLSGLSYCLSSCSMILVNKYVLSSYDFNAGISLMLYQNFISVFIVSMLSTLGVISTEALTRKLIKAWLPVNVIFVGMLITSMFSLRYINVAMVTVLKNVTNVITAVGEMYLVSKHHDNRVWVALFLMIISAISGGFTDLSFHAVGYTWQLINCFLTASYSLTLRRVMETAKLVTKSGNLNEFSMVLLNNTLSLPLGLVLIYVFNEAASEATHLLVGDDFEWIIGISHQLYFYVVSSSNKCYYLQSCGITEQDTSFDCWHFSFQSPNQSGKFCEHSDWPSCWSVLCKGQGAGEITILTT